MIFLEEKNTLVDAKRIMPYGCVMIDERKMILNVK
jgi:hypothetical protein